MVILKNVLTFRLPGILRSTLKFSGAQTLNNIKLKLAEQNALCVFAEPQFRPAVIKAVAKGTNAKMGVLDPLGSGIAVDRDGYTNFLSRLSAQYASCLEQ